MEHLFFTIQNYGSYLNEHGYDIDLHKSIYENGLFDKLNDYYIRGLRNYFYFQGIAEVTLFDPVETDHTKNTLTYSSVPVIGYFYDEDNELIHFDKSEKDKLTKVFEPYYLSKCFFDFNDIIENTSLALPKGCIDYKIIYTLTLDKKSASLDNLRVLKKDVIIQKKQINVIDVELKPKIDTLTTINTQLQTELEQARATITQLKEQLAQAQQVTPADEVNDIILNYNEIKAVKGIYNEFWTDYDPLKKERPAKQITVIEWVTTNYPSISDSMARFLDKIVRQKHIKK